MMPLVDFSPFPLLCLDGLWGVKECIKTSGLPPGVLICFRGKSLLLAKRSGKFAES
jgi:hypothetical protein